MKKILVLLLFASAAFAQGHDHGPAAKQKTFDQLKTLAGSWEGAMTTIPKVPSIEGTATHVTFRVTSMGNVLMHEMTGAGRADDPITMLYLDGENLTLTHYCDAGNRPRMTGKVSADGKTIEFHFVELSGSNEYGHMNDAVFTFIDADHHVEDWTYMMPGDKPMRAHVELHRTK
jgi:hypothetical protein